MNNSLYNTAAFLPVSPAEVRARNWEQPDFVYVTGDAYVDHPSFGPAIISRVLEQNGYKVAMLPQPDWNSDDSFRLFGKPRLGFLVCAGNIDSMVNHYTVAKKPRSEDAYSPGGKPGLRPDRATIVYCNCIRRAYGNVPIIIGGIEASLRRFAHYDYWDDRVRNSILVDSGADLLIYGMGERPIVEAANQLSAWYADCIHRFNEPPRTLRCEFSAIRGTCQLLHDKPDGYADMPDATAVRSDKRAYCEAFMAQYHEQDPVRGSGLTQRHSDRYLVQHPPQPPLSPRELDAVHALPYTREWHPMYDAAGGIPALNEVKFSVMATRGCFGACSFCALTFHQGRIVTARSHQSVIDEVRELSKAPDFKGYIHDVGGPTANFRAPTCPSQLKNGACPHRQCLYPDVCKNAQPDHAEFIELLRKLRGMPTIKKVFIRSGLRFDWMLADKHTDFLRELVSYHVSGQLKVAPEHISPRVLSYMGKPGRQVFDEFAAKYANYNKRAGKEQYLVCYFMSSHPGSELSDAIELAEYLRDSGHKSEQVQDFYPTPGTLSTTMYYTGLDPRTMQKVYVARSPQEKAMQRALMQYYMPQNAGLVRKALRIAGREDLIGFDKHCLVQPAYAERKQPSPGKGGNQAAARLKQARPSQTRETGQPARRVSSGKRAENTKQSSAPRRERRK